VVGDDPVMDLALAVRVGAGRLRAGLDQRPHQVGVVVVMLALQKRADPLQPHAGVDGLVRQVGHPPIGVLLVLHEDQIPDLDEPVAILLR